MPRRSSPCDGRPERTGDLTTITATFGDHERALLAETLRKAIEDAPEGIEAEAVGVT